MKPWLASEQQLLCAEIKQNKLPHALLVSGVVGAGKLAFSSWLTGLLACSTPITDNTHNVFAPCGHCKHCKLIASHSYPDHKLLETDNRSISVDEVRLANQFFEKTAQLGEFKTLIIPFAEKMTIAAANALLKTLEEPTGNSLIILLSEQADILLPTIVSRCRKITLRPPTGDALLESFGARRNQPFANLSQMPELENPELASNYQELFTSFIGLLENKGNRNALIQQLDGNKHALRWLEKICAELLRQEFDWSTSTGIEKFPQESLWKISQLVLTCTKRIKTLNQANATFEYEKLVGDITRIAAH